MIQFSHKKIHQGHVAHRAISVELCVLRVSMVKKINQKEVK